jgi:NDP-sugar pyrophosphorylase family protein
MKAVILAGGKGTRLAPYTAVFPKPLVPIGEQPILEIILRQLAHHGFHDITLTVGHLAELIRAYLHHASPRFAGLTISYVTEESPTGTAGSLVNVPDLTETFMVMNGDVLTTLDYRRLLAFHREKGGLMTIATQRRSVKVDLGVLEHDEDGGVINYIEKPKYDFRVSMGVYVYEPRVLEFIDPGAYLDVPTLVLRLTERGEKVMCYQSDDYWMDIGRIEDYARAQEDFERMRDLFLPSVDVRTGTARR